MQPAEHRPSPGQLLPIVVLIVGCCLGLGAGPAMASHVNCGDTITADTTLDSDLVNCPNNGIVIEADDVTLDLNGHTIDGDGEFKDDCAADEFCDFGVVAFDHDRVTIRDGSVREFVFGVLIVGATENRLLDLSLTGHIFSGVLIAESTETELRRSVVAANGLDTDQAGIDVFDSAHSWIARNSISDNGDIGIFAEGVEDTTFERNELSDNPEAGMLIGGSNRNVYDRNRLVRNGEGITIDGDENTITRNHVADARAGEEGAGLGIFVATGHDNLVERNFVAGATRSGIQVSLSAEDLQGGTPAVDTVVRRNQLRGNGDGLFVQTTALGTVLERNHAVRSADDGIDVNSRTATLIGNHALHNGDLGIEAVFGVIDGGRNKARGNGNSLQCTNVACR
jgi:large repetitive protein